MFDKVQENHFLEDFKQDKGRFLVGGSLFFNKLMTLCADGPSFVETPAASFDGSRDQRLNQHNFRQCDVFGGFWGPYALSFVFEWGVFFLFRILPPKRWCLTDFFNSLLVLLIFSVLPSCRWKYKEVKYGIWAFLRIEKDPADDFQLVHEFSFFCEYSL